MIGIFDSGVGGLASYREVRRLLPREDIIYLADRKNAPYGTKTKEELIPLVSEDIRRLSAMGAERILIACCTASAVYPLLDSVLQKAATPIIIPSASEAAALGERITVIATEYTAKSLAFTKAIIAKNPRAEVTEISAQRLVALVEGGASDGALDESSERTVERIAERIRATHPEVLILGCTHFSHLSWELSDRLPCVKTVTPAIVGAREFVKKYIEEKNTVSRERGRTVYA